jgi:putative phage-type endonuclease
VVTQGSPEWVAERRGYVGASDLAAILGRDPWRSEYELALEKRGLSEPRADTWPMAWGHRVQRLGIEVYHDLTGKRVRNVGTTTANPRWPHVRASLDGRVVREPRACEVKFTSRTVTEAPEHWVLQAQGQMGVCNLDAVDIVRLSGRDEPAIFTVERDDALIGDLLPMAEAWYVRYILGDELPPVDGSRGASRHLDRMAGPPEMAADEGQAAMAQALRAVRAALAVKEADERLLVNRLKESMAGAYAMTGEGWRVSWRPSKERTTVDWKAVAAAYRAELLAFHEALGGDGTAEAAEALDAIESLHSATGEGARPFRVTFDEED